MNDPYYRTIGIGSSVWLAGARGHVYSEGTQHSSICERRENGVPSEGAGTLALTADMKKMDSAYVRGLSLRGYGVSLALGVGVPIPVLDGEVLKAATVRDRDIYAPVIDYSFDYPQRNGLLELGRNEVLRVRCGEVRPLVGVGDRLYRLRTLRFRPGAPLRLPRFALGHLVSLS